MVAVLSFAALFWSRLVELDNREMVRSIDGCICVATLGTGSIDEEPPTKVENVGGAFDAMFRFKLIIYCELLEARDSGSWHVRSI